MYNAGRHSITWQSTAGGFEMDLARMLAETGTVGAQIAHLQCLHHHTMLLTDNAALRLCKRPETPPNTPADLVQSHIFKFCCARVLCDAFSDQPLRACNPCFVTGSTLLLLPTFICEQRFAASFCVVTCCAKQGAVLHLCFPFRQPGPHTVLWYAHGTTCVTPTKFDG